MSPKQQKWHDFDDALFSSKYDEIVSFLQCLKTIAEANTSQTGSKSIQVTIECMAKARDLIRQSNN